MNFPAQAGRGLAGQLRGSAVALRALQVIDRTTKNTVMVDTTAEQDEIRAGDESNRYGRQRDAETAPGSPGEAPNTIAGDHVAVRGHSRPKVLTPAHGGR